jgi:hypothetical protein
LIHRTRLSTNIWSPSCLPSRYRNQWCPQRQSLYSLDLAKYANHRKLHLRLRSPHILRWATIWTVWYVCLCIALLMSNLTVDYGRQVDDDRVAVTATHSEELRRRKIKVEATGEQTITNSIIDCERTPVMVADTGLPPHTSAEVLEEWPQHESINPRLARPCCAIWTVRTLLQHEG